MWVRTPKVNYTIKFLSVQTPTLMLGACAASRIQCMTAQSVYCDLVDYILYVLFYVCQSLAETSMYKENCTF
jgi:hypothetical protein